MQNKKANLLNDLERQLIVDDFQLHQYKKVTDGKNGIYDSKNKSAVQFLLKKIYSKRQRKVNDNLARSSV